ncbi:hypothetical protein CWRG_01781 [Chthonomonas calidirosea]|nr:hypothetical protein CWRG_01781 [Chthonomonas calidirosea]
MLLRHLLAAFLTALVLTLACLGATTWAVQTPNTSILETVRLATRRTARMTQTVRTVVINSAIPMG